MAIRSRRPVWPALALPCLIWACNAHPFAAPAPAVDQQTDHYYEVNAPGDVDILFVIDNSGSMREEQNNLRRNFGVFMQELRKIPGPDGMPRLPDVHIGVVSTDLGAGPTPHICRVGGDSGHFRTGAGGCGLDPAARYIVSLGNETRNNFRGDLVEVFKCMAELGAEGCGFEHQLESARVALTRADNKSFLRPQAYLAIVILTDEDDCSADPQSDLFCEPVDPLDPGKGCIDQYPGTEFSFRCAQTGHLCGGNPPPRDGVFASPLAACSPNDGGRLIPVSRFVESIRALKSRPDKVIVAGIFGWPTEQDPGRPYEYARIRRTIDNTVTRDLNGNLDYMDICEARDAQGKPTGQGKATAALRVKQVVAAFDGVFESICQSDFAPVMKKIGERIASKLPRACVNRPIVDRDDKQAGLQPECVVAYRDPDAARPTGFREILLPECQRATSGQSCWKLASDDACISKYKVEIDKRQMPPPNAHLVIHCATCPTAGDPRCAVQK